MGRIVTAQVMQEVPKDHHAREVEVVLNALAVIGYLNRSQRLKLRDIVNELTKFAEDYEKRVTVADDKAALRQERARERYKRDAEKIKKRRKAYYASNRAKILQEMRDTYRRKKARTAVGQP